jgi:hypothetical protein
MIWTQTNFNDLVLLSKDLSDKLGELVIRDLTLGKDINTNLDLLQLIENILFGLEYGTIIYKDEHYDYAAELVDIIHRKCFKYVGL